MAKGNLWILLVIIGSLLYFNSLFNGFVWDDEEQVVNNALVHSINNIPALFSGSTFNTGGSGSLGGIYYKPLMSTIFAIIYTVFGNNPALFHLFQISVHIANSIIVFFLFKIFLKRGVAFFLSLIFLIHPINTETVVYVSALQDTLYLLFGLLALLLSITKPAGLKTYFTVGLLLLLSLLSKETGLLFLLIILLMKTIFAKKQLKPFIITFLSVTTFYLLLRFAVANVPFGNGSLSPIMRTTIWERLINIPAILFFYLRTFLIPLDLATAQHWVVKKISFNDFYIPLIWISSLFTLAVIFMFHLKKQPKTFLLFFFFLLWTMAGLVLHSQIIPLDMTVAERWFYFPMVGILGMIGILAEKVTIKHKFQAYYYSAILILLIILAGRTITRTFDWRNGLTLFSHDIKVSKNAFDLENNLGVELYRVSRFSEAKNHFGNSTQLAPYWWTNWNNLGVMYEREGDLNTAGQYYQKAIQNGHYSLAYENMAKILLSSDGKSAEEFTRKSLKVLPNNPRLWLILSLAQYKQNKNNEAKFSAKQSYLLLPNPQSYYIFSRLEQNLPLEIK